MTSQHLQPMPVADAICAPGRVMLYPPYDKNDPMLSTTNLQNCSQWAWSTKFRDEMLVKCKRVNFGAAPSQNDVMPVKGIDILDGVKLGELLRDAVGPQILPYDHMWFEGAWPHAEQWLSPHTEAVAVRAKTGEAIYRDTGQPVPPNTYQLAGPVLPAEERVHRAAAGPSAAVHRPRRNADGGGGERLRRKLSVQCRSR